MSAVMWVVAVVVGQGDVGVSTIMEVASANAAHKAAARGDAVPPQFVLAALTQAEGLIDREGVPFDEAAHEWLRAELTRVLEAEVRAFPPAPGPARTAAWARLARLVTTPRLAQQVLEQWLEFPPLTPEIGWAAGAWSQAVQVEGAETFKFEGLTVVDEVGGAGLVNQLLDPGEWAKVQVTFSNATRLPWFSTSAFAKGSECLWVDEKTAALVGELAPAGQATVAWWVFVPERCVEPTVLSVTLADTHRGTQAGAFSLALTPTTAVRARATQLRLDTDALGSSDGTKVAQLGPDLRFELVTNVRVPGDQVASVATSWSLARPARPLFSVLSERAVASVAQGNGVFLAGDDLDGEAVDERRWAQVASAPGLSRWLVAPAPGRLWFALDTTVVLRGPTPKPAARGKTPPVVAAAPPSASLLADLVRQYVDLAPHSVPRERPNAVEAVSGYELLFDRAGFMRAYDALLAPRTTLVEPAEAPTVRVVFRSYIAVPAVPVQAQAHEPELRAPPPLAEVEATPEAPPPRRNAPAPSLDAVTWAQVEVGAGASVFGVRNVVSAPAAWGAATLSGFPTFGARVFVGPSLVGLAGVRYSTLSVVPQGSVFTFSELAGELGAGYRFGSRRLSVTPYAAAVFQVRTFTTLADRATIGALVALNARVGFSPWLGLSLDLGVPIGLAGPYGFSSFSADADVIGVVGGVGFRGLVSLSLTF